MKKAGREPGRARTASCTEARADALPDAEARDGQWTRFRDPSLLNSRSFDSFPPEFRTASRPVPANLFGTATRRSSRRSSTSRSARPSRPRACATQSGQEEIRRVRAGGGPAGRAGLQRLRAQPRAGAGGAQQAVRQKEIQLETTRNRRAAGVATELDVLRFEVDLENARAVLLRVEGRRSWPAASERGAGAAHRRAHRAHRRPRLPGDGGDAGRGRGRGLGPRGPRSSRCRPGRAHPRRVRSASPRPTCGQAWSSAAPWAGPCAQTANFFEDDFNRWSAGLVLTVPVFDGLRTAGKVAQAQAEQNKVAQDRIALENQIRLEAQDAVDRLNVAAQGPGGRRAERQPGPEGAGDDPGQLQATAPPPCSTCIDAQAAPTQADSNRVQALSPTPTPAPPCAS